MRDEKKKGTGVDMRKKFVMLGIVSAMMMGLFAGCGSDTGNKEDNTATQTDANGSNVDVNDNNVDDKDVSEEDLKSAGAVVADGVNSTGYAIFKNLYDGGNICISPYSIESAMAMITNGAENDTLRELMESLGIEDIDSFNQAMKTVNSGLQGDGATVDIANSLWRNGSVKDTFAEDLKDYYSAEVKDVDFSDEGTVDEINQWVSNATNDKINRLVDRLDSGTNAVILNAVYFNGKFAEPFPKNNTMEGRFFTGDGSNIKTDMMAIYDGSFPYYEGNGLKAVRLAYEDSNVVMDLYITDKNGMEVEGENAVDIYNSLTDEQKQEMYNALSTGEVKELTALSMPKFEFASETISIKDVLMKMGINKAFSEEAEFGKIGDNTMLSDVLHKTYIKVDEEGTEAAGVTAGLTKETAMPVEEVYNFVADQPFVYVISDSSTGAILFMGAMTDVDPAVD